MLAEPSASARVWKSRFWVELFDGFMVGRLAKIDFHLPGFAFGAGWKHRPLPGCCQSLFCSQKTNDTWWQDAFKRNATFSPPPPSPATPCRRAMGLIYQASGKSMMTSAWGASTRNGPCHGVKQARKASGRVLAACTVVESSTRDITVERGMGSLACCGDGVRFASISRRRPPFRSSKRAINQQEGNKSAH